MNAENELLENIKPVRHNAWEFLDRIITFANAGDPKIGARMLKFENYFVSFFAQKRKTDGNCNKGEFSCEFSDESK